MKEVLKKKTSLFKRIIASVLTMAMMVSMSGMSGVVFAEDVEGKVEVEEKRLASLLEPVERVDQEILDQSGNLKIGEGPEILVPQTKNNWSAPLQFVNSGTLTVENPMDMYFFTTTSPKFPMIKIVADNPNYVVQLYQYEASTGEALPIQFYDFAGDNNPSHSPSLPAYSFIWAVYSVNDTVGDPYTLMVNTDNPANPTYVGYVSDDLSKTTMIYGTETIVLNGKYVSLPESVGWARETDVPVGDGYIHEEQSVSGVSDECVAMVSYGKYDSTKYKTNNAVFFEIMCPAQLPPLDANPLWTYFYSSYLPKPNGIGYEYKTNHDDLTGQTTPRRLSIVDREDIFDITYEYRLR